MKENIIQITVNENTIFALCTGGKIYSISIDLDGKAIGEWELVTESPKIQYKKAGANV